MKFSLDYTVEVDGADIASSQLFADIDQHKDSLGEVHSIEGSIIVSVDGQAHDLELSEPLVRLCGLLLRKMPWVIAGDTETVALRNSEQCFALTPAGDGCEFSFFTGTELEVEEYVLEPFTVRLNVLVPQIIGMGERLLSMLRAVDPSVLDSDEDSQDLIASLSEAQNAWKEYQRSRR